VVYDDADHRLTVFSATGRKRWSAEPKDVRNLNGVVLASPKRVWAFDRSGGRIVAIDSKGVSAEVSKDSRLSWGGPLVRGGSGRFYVGSGRGVSRLSRDGKIDKTATAHRNLPPGKLLKPRTFALIGTDEVAIQNASARAIEIFAREGTFRRRVTFDTGGMPTLVAGAGRELVVHDGSTGTLSLVDSRGKRTAILRSARLRNVGMCTFGPKGSIYALSWSRNGGIVKLNGKGKEIGVVKSGRGDNEFRWPRAIAVTPRGELLVVDGRRSRVFCYDEKLKFKWVFQPTNRKSGGRQNGVSAIATDRAGRMYLLSQGEGVVWQYSPERKHVETFAVPAELGEMTHPEAIHLDNDGTLYVADTNNSRIVVFEPKE